MSHKEVFKLEQIEKFLSSQLRRSDVARLFDVSERTISRIARRVERNGLMGIKHGNCGRRPTNKKSDLIKAHVCRLIRETYFDYNMTHLKETLKEGHGISVAYSTLRRWCHEINVVKKRHRGRQSNTRKRRARSANEGFLLQMDGSPHYYVPLKEWTLIAAIDDATNKIVAAKFYDAETTFNYMEMLEQIVIHEGIPWGIYVDRAGCLGGSKRAHFSEFRRACEELEIHVIFANSPQGKGRIERWFQTPQDRLVAELRTNGITDITAANHYLNERFIKDYWNIEKIVEPTSSENKFRKLNPKTNLKEILSMREYRKINNDNTFKWKTLIFQINDPPGNIVNQEVEIRLYKNGESTVWFAGKKLDVVQVEKIINKKTA